MALNASQLLAAIPSVLRDPLLEEYQEIVKNYLEHRWSPAELSGGRFCEIVYTVLDGHARGTYGALSKPRDFVGSCRALESNTHVPRSFQILIPRMLPALYEIRNNRGVGHVGGDVDPNHMDANAVLAIASWVLAELVRVFHDVGATDAQAAVDAIVERRVPLVWSRGGIKRVLNTSLSLKEQVIVLLGSSPGGALVSDLLDWTEYRDRGYFLRVLRGLHGDRLIELASDGSSAQLLPPGVAVAEQLLADHAPSVRPR